MNRNFVAVRPDALWFSDITEHEAREGTLYCCVVDQYSRRVVGWAIDRPNEANLVNDVLTMAVPSRASLASHHRALRSRDASSPWSFTQNLKHHQLVGSMATIGDCF